jgi:PmbA protein
MNFQDTAARIERLLAGRGLDGYEIMLGASRQLSVEVKEQQVDSFKCAAPVGVGVRVLKDRGMGFSFSTSLDDADLGRMVDNALVAAVTQTPDEHNAFPVPAPFPEIPGMYDEGLAAVSEQEKIDRAMELERLTLAADPRMQKVRKCTYSETDYSVFLRNSLGVEGEYRGTLVSSSVSAIAASGDESQMGWDFGFATTFGGVDVAAIARGAAAKATGLLGARKIPTMRCPVVLDNYVATEILEVLASAFLAENVQKGKSLLAGRLGERLFSPLLRISDDGTLAGGMATTPFDGEGVAQQDTLLVSDGILRAFLYDTFCARKDGVASTGNAVRGSVKSAPRMGVSNLFIENGTPPMAELGQGIERGVLLTEVMGMHTANPISGDFSVGAAGHLIEGGVVTVPVKGIAIAGNILELFRSVEGVGNDLRFYGGVGAPSLRIACLDVSGE